MGERKKINVLILEDVPSDAELVKLYLQEAVFNCQFKVVDSGQSFHSALTEFRPDLIVSDFNLPSFTGFKALKMMQDNGVDVPFIFVTGTLGEENAVEAIKMGATDFIIKERVENLPAAVMRAFREHREKQQRREEQQRFKALIENSHECVMVFDENTVISYVSPAVGRLLGYAPMELLGRPVLSLFHQEDVESRENMMRELVTTDITHFEDSARLLAKDGTYLWISAIISDNRLTEGVNGFVANFHNVDELVKTNQRLKESEQYLRSIFDNTLAAIVVADDSGRYIQANQGAAELFGYPLEKLIGMRVSELSTPTEDGDLSERYTKYMEKSVEQSEFRFTRPSGEDRVAIYQAVRVRDDFNISFLVDITERKQMQEQLRESQQRMKQVTDLMPGAIFRFRVSPDGTQELDYISDGVKNLSGYDASEYEGEFSNVIKKLIHPDDISEFVSAVMKSITTKSSFKHEFRSICKDGSVLWAAAQSTPTIDDNDHSLVYHGVLTDVTNEKQLSLNLQDLADELKGRVKEQQLLYKVSRMLQESKPDVQQVLGKVAEAIPAGLNHPECSVAEVVFEGQRFASEPVPDTKWVLEQRFKASTGEKGRLRVYCKATPPDGEWPFTEEEEELVNTLSSMMKGWIDKIHVEQQLQETLENLEKLVRERTQKLEQAHERLEVLYGEVTDSINYAKRIQDAILPPLQVLKEAVEDAFIFYRPKDVVSGDFYWFKKYEGRLFIACVDCTGHGVPGALMSMIGNELLEHTVIDRKISRPDIVLEEMDKAIVRLLRKEHFDHGVEDGMDISVCVIDPETRSLSFAGAHNAGYIVNPDGVTKLPADRQAIGGAALKGVKEFNRTTHNYKSGDRLYLFSDGYYDQFGGKGGKKFLRKNLIELLYQNHQRSMEEQEALLITTFDKWKGDQFQVDDVTVIGLLL